MTLADHAIAWATENGETIPPFDSPAFIALYERWVEWAFSDLHGKEKP